LLLPSLARGLLDRCILLAILAILALSNVHAVVGVLNVLAFDDLHVFVDVYAISSVLAVLNLGVFAPLIIALHDMVIIASCKPQHESLIVVWELSVLPLHLSVIVVAPCNMTVKIDCCIIDVVSWHCGQSYCGRFMPS
jgi:hypothetical protein